MINWIDEQAARARYDAIERSERQLALARAAQAGQPAAPRFYGPVLARVGRRLAVWGASLEARYNPPLGVGACEGGTH